MSQKQTKTPRALDPKLSADPLCGISFAELAVRSMRLPSNQDSDL